MQTSCGQWSRFLGKNGDSKLMTDHDVTVEHVQTKEWSAGFLGSNNSLEIKLNNESSLSTFKSDEILMENSSRCAKVILQMTSCYF